MAALDPDTELMLRVQRGDETAFPALVARFLRPLAAFFCRLGADGTTAEDCAQDVFLKLYRTRATYVPRARLSTYLFSIARNHWIDVVRHRAAGPPTVAGEALEEVGREAPVDARARAEEVGRAIRRAVADLPPDQRELFALATDERLRYQEIAEILGIPVGTVKSRVHATMTALRARLAREGLTP